MEEAPTYIKVTTDSPFYPFPIDEPKESEPQQSIGIYAPIDCLDRVYIGGKLPNNDYIRLVGLRVEPVKPGQNGSQLVLTIQTMRLDEAPEYSALSYNWGPLWERTQNSFHGWRLSQNLKDAVEFLASAKPGLWWTDALCINQDDAEEKNQQVRMMKQIYSRAEQVCAWLGRGDEATDRCIDLGHQITELLRNGKIRYPSSEPPKKFCNRELEAIGLPATDDTVWIDFVKLISRPYFYRIWVLQELVTAKEPILLVCGRRGLTWEYMHFSTVWLCYTGWLRAIEIQTDNVSHVGQSLLKLVSQLRDSKMSSNLVEVLRMSRGLKATDPRDHIIAVLGLVSAEDKAIASIEPRYDQPVTDSTAILLEH